MIKAGIKAGKPRHLSAGCYRMDDVSAGDVIQTPSHLVTLQDIDQFAALTGDMFAIHMDEDAARDYGFAGRVAHGLLVLSMVDGLKNQAEAQLDAIASLGWNLQFTAPVLAGDSISASLTIESLRATSDGHDGMRRGIAIFDVTVQNQKGQIVQKGQNTLLIKR